MVAAILLAGCGTTPERPVATGVSHPQLREELRAMESADQLVRQRWLQERTPALTAEVDEELTCAICSG